jgi:hypothetical protein
MLDRMLRNVGDRIRKDAVKYLTKTEYRCETLKISKEI